MYAVIEVCGKQYRVAEGTKIVVDRMAVEVGSEIALDRVLMLGGDTVKVGSPLVAGASATATVMEHSRGKKVLVFKKWRRNDSRKLRGHRQDLTTLKINSIKS